MYIHIRQHFIGSIIVPEHKSDHRVLVIDEVMCSIIVTKQSNLFCLFMIEVYIGVLPE